jgi:DNA polymerase III epsilon subunit-like protein
MKPTYAVIDTETTGFGGEHEICEIAVIVMDWQFSVLEIFDTLVRPRGPNGAEMVNNISESMLQDAPDASVVSGALEDLFRRREVTTIVGHNVRFDLGFMQRQFPWFRDTGQSLCTLLMSQQKRILSRGGKLEVLAEALRVPKIPGMMHSAFVDAAVCAAVFRMLMRIEIPPAHSPILWPGTAFSGRTKSRTTKVQRDFVLDRLALMLKNC